MRSCLLAAIASAALVHGSCRAGFDRLPEDEVAAADASSSAVDGSPAANDAAAGGTGTADASPIFPDATPVSGQLLFVSSTTTNGGLGSADLADVFCQEAANGAGHTGTFRAVVSGDLDPAINRLVISGPVVNALGEEVASDATQFWSGSLSASVGLNEFGVPVATNVHTGTTATGDEHMLNCQSWTSSGGASARVGVSTATDGRWLDDSSLNCNTVLPMYCLRQ